MANVSRKWLLENCSKVWGFGGQLTQENLTEWPVPKGGFETTLTAKGVGAVEAGEYQKKFNALLPGVGWLECFPR